MTHKLATTVDADANKIALVDSLSKTNGANVFNLWIYGAGKTVKDDNSADQPLLLADGEYTVTTSLKVSIPAVVPAG